MATVESDKNSSAKLIFCPGCKRGHAFYTSDHDSPNGAVWTFNGDYDKPTFSPSMHVTIMRRTRSNPTGERITLCHSFVRNGKIQFLNDSQHRLAGQTVDLPNWNDV